MVEAVARSERGAIVNRPGDGLDSSDDVRVAQFGRSAIGVEQDVVGCERCGAESWRDNVGLVHSEMSWRSGVASTVRVPGVEGGGRSSEFDESADGVDEVVVVVGRALEVFAPEAQSCLSGEPPGAIAESGRVAGCAFVDLGVENRAGDLGVMRPGAAVEVVGSDDQEHIVDDADLCVYVDRSGISVFEVVDGYALASGAAEDLGDVFTADSVRSVRERPAAVGVSRHDGDDVKVGFASELVGECVCGVEGPEVLVLEVDEAARPTERLEIGAGDAAFPVGRERERGTLGRVGP